MAVPWHAWTIAGFHATSQSLPKRRGEVMRLSGKTAMITGASRNIGKQVALTFAREGADLLLNTRVSQQDLDDVATACRAFDVKTHTVLGDVSDSARVNAMVQEGIDILGKIDVLVCNTGIRPHRPITE